MPYSAPHSQQRDGLVADPFVFLLELYNSACKRTQSLALGSADILLCTALLSKDATVGSSAGGQDNKKWWPRVYWKESYDKPRQHIKKQRHHFADKGPYSQSYGFYSSHVWMWELGHEEGWTLKINNVLLEKTLDSPLDCKEIKPVNPKGNQPWIIIGRTDAEVEAPILWPPDAKSQLVGKDLDAGNDWWQEEKGMTEDEMVGWHHWLNGHEWANSRR